MSTLVRVISVLLLSLSVFGCNPLKDKKTAEADVAAFHQRYDDEDYHVIYAQASDEFKKSDTEKGIVEYFAKVHAKLGKVRSAREVGFNVNSNQNGTMVVLNYQTEFEFGTGQETFTYRVSGKDPKLVGYNINSKALVLN